MDDSIPELRREPAAFARVLATKEPLLLVGGQAVNLWAMYYGERTVDLAPFVSHDVDVLGDRQTLVQIASLANAKARFFPMRPPTNEVGVVMAEDTHGKALAVEVLSDVHGVTNEELREWTYTVEIGDTGVHVQIPGPIALLKAKIANAFGLPKEGRQDERHVRILAALMPAYLSDLCASVDGGRLKEKRMLAVLERLLGVTTSSQGRTVLRRLGLSPMAMFEEMPVSGPARIHGFLTKRLPRALRRESTRNE